MTSITEIRQGHRRYQGQARRGQETSHRIREQAVGREEGRRRPGMKIVRTKNCVGLVMLWLKKKK